MSKALTQFVIFLLTIKELAYYGLFGRNSRRWCILVQCIKSCTYHATLTFFKRLMYSITFEQTITWKLQDYGLEISFYHKNEPLTLIITASTIKLKEITSLLDEYFALLHSQQKNAETVPNNAKPFLLNSCDAYLHFPARVFLGRFGSRLEFFKAFYMESCALAKQEPVRPLCKFIDNCIDCNIDLTEIDLGSQLNNDKLELLTKAVAKAMEFSYVSYFAKMIMLVLIWSILGKITLTFNHCFLVETSLGLQHVTTSCHHSN